MYSIGFAKKKLSTGLLLGMIDDSYLVVWKMNLLFPMYTNSFFGSFGCSSLFVSRVGLASMNLLILIQFFGTHQFIFFHHHSGGYDINYKALTIED